MKKTFFVLFVIFALLFPACDKSVDELPAVPQAGTVRDDAPDPSPEEISAPVFQAAPPAVSKAVPPPVQPENTATAKRSPAGSPSASARSGTPLPPLSGIKARPMGVFTGELDPLNYDTVDSAVLLRMGLEQDHVSFIMGERYFKAGNYDKALVEYDKAIALNGNFPAALFSRGRIYHEKGDLDRTIADYSDAIRLKNDSVVVYNYRGYAYAQNGNHDRAIQDYSQAIALKRDYGDAWFNRGFSYWEKGDYDRAIADFTRLIELEPKNATVYNQRGIVWYSMGDDRKAVLDFSEAIRLNQNFPLAWHNRGVAWRALGDEDRARKDFAEAARLGYR
ncbi:MAG: tetratricopeptide repeat protein [Treponema sp.]|jgi:tetratricopeptide (TPR) repeat protein|nr:tetratricopeptide repeat protein [Treponema sp.]